MKITELPDSVFSILFLPAKYRALAKMLTWIADLVFIPLYNCSVLCLFLPHSINLPSFLLLLLLLLPFSTIQAFFFLFLPGPSLCIFTYCLLIHYTFVHNDPIPQFTIPPRFQASSSTGVHLPSSPGYISGIKLFLKCSEGLPMFLVR